MADLGTLAVVQSSDPVTLGAYGFGPPLNLGSLTIVDMGGSGSGGSVTPKRYLNVGGTATPIQ